MIFSLKGSLVSMYSKFAVAEELLILLQGCCTISASSTFIVRSLNSQEEEKIVGKYGTL